MCKFPISSNLNDISSPYKNKVEDEMVSLRLTNMVLKIGPDQLVQPGSVVLLGSLKKTEN